VTQSKSRNVLFNKTTFNINESNDRLQPQDIDKLSIDYENSTLFMVFNVDDNDKINNPPNGRIRTKYIKNLATKHDKINLKVEKNDQESDDSILFYSIDKSNTKITSKNSNKISTSEINKQLRRIKRNTQFRLKTDKKIKTLNEAKQSSLIFYSTFPRRGLDGNSSFV
jgi:hypothetical protein